MKTLLRAGFLLMMMLAIQQRILWFNLGQAAEPPLTTLARKLAALGLPNTGPDQNGLIQISAPGCAPFQVGLFALDGAEDSRIAALLPPGSQPRYIYLGRTAPARPLLHPVTAWLAASIAAMAGARHSQPPTKLVLAALPANCPHVAALDWASVSQ